MCCHWTCENLNANLRRREQTVSLPCLTCGGQRRTHASSSPLSLPSFLPPAPLPLLPIFSRWHHIHTTLPSSLSSLLPHFSVFPQQQPHPGASALRTQSFPPFRQSSQLWCWDAKAPLTMVWHFTVQLAPAWFSVCIIVFVCACLGACVYCKFASKYAAQMS